MKKQRLIISWLIIFILFQTAVWSQLPDWTVYTNGKHITAIAAETDFIWAGTTGGLIKINKSTLQVSDFFTTANSDLPMNHITSIAVDAQGSKWIGTSGRGLARFDGISSFVYYTAPQIPGDTVLAVNTYGSTIRIGTTHGIAEFSGSIWNVISGPNFLPSDTVTAMITGPTGHMVIGTQRGAVIFDGSAYNNVTSNLPDLYVTGVTVDINDTAWVGMNYGGIAKWTMGAWRIYNMANTQNGLPSDMIRSITGDASGRIWIGTGTNGLVQFFNNVWTTFDTTNSGIPDNNVTALLAETTGDLWVGTWNGGIALFSGTAWTPVQVTNSGLRDDAVLAVSVSQSGVLWACGSNYITRFDGATWMTYTPETLGVYQGGFTGLLLDASGDPWVSTFEQGLFHYDGTQWIPINTSNTTGFPDNFINAMTANPLNGELWIATYNGVGHYNGASWTTYNTASSPPVPNNIIRALDVGSNGTVWIADDQSAGPLRFDQTMWTMIDASPIGVYPGTISAIWVSESGNPWIGTQGLGIAHYTASGWAYQQTTSNSVIPGNNVQSLETDLDGNLWVGTTQGLGILSRPTTFTALFHSSDSDLPSNSIRSLTYDSQNRVYIATDSGLVVYRGVSHTGQSDLFIRNHGMFGFDTLTVNQSMTISGYLLNTGTVPLSIDSLHWVENVQGAFTWLSPQLPYSVPVNDSVQVSVQFNPDQVLFYGGQIHIFSSSAGSPDTLYIGGSVTAPQVTVPFILHPWQFSMISVPGILENTDIRTALSSSLGSYSSKTWRIFYWKDGRYLELTDFSVSDSLTLRPGIAFWLIPKDTAEIVLQNVSATPPIIYEGQFARIASYPIRLEPGWNMIGDPFAYPISWNQITESNLVYRPVSYNGWYYTYQNEVINPWEGYFVYNPQDTSVTLRVNPFPSSFQKISARPLREGEFSMDIEARGLCSNRRTGMNRVGMLKTAADGHDAEDYPEAPLIGSFLRMNILDQGNCYAGNYRAVDPRGARWDIHVETTGQAEMVTLTFFGGDHLPAGFSVWLMDKNREIMVPVTKGQAVIAVPDSGKYADYSLIIGTQAYAESEVHGLPLIPVDFALLPNVPNPFNPETVIEFHLSQKSDVHLEIYNVRGQRVRTLVHAMISAGRHSVVWDGRDDAGRSAGSGIYICRIESPNFHAAHKMIMVR
jgi:ligand-binding sensor domain-containing protein